MKILTKVMALIITVAMFVFISSPSVCALTVNNGSITLNVTDSQTGAPLQGATFRIYFFAKAYQSGNSVKFELISPYDECNLEMDDLQDSYLPVHLSYFAAANELDYTEKSTDSNGVVVFDNLASGLYLVVPSDNDSGYNLSAPFIVSVPEYDSVNKEWNFDINASPKINGGTEDDSSEKYISVQKKWETDGSHPESITVVLLRDFQEFEKIELNEENNWYYRWDNLSKDHVWDVIEMVVPDGYTVRYETSSNTVTIINRYDGEDEEPDDSDEPTTKPSVPGDSDGDDDDDLADTGQLNWPVPVFAIAGLVLFGIGWAILNLGNKESE